MKLTGRILTSAISLGLSVQSLPAIVSYAEENNTIVYSTYKGAEGATYIKISLTGKEYEITIPDEYNGEKIDKINLRDISIPYDEDVGTSAEIKVYIPDGVELGNTEWKDSENGLALIKVYSSKESGEYYYAERSLISTAPTITTGNNKAEFSYNVKNVALNKVNFSTRITNNLFVDEFILILPEDANIIRDNWMAKKTHILSIKVCDPSGKTELYKADDYDEYKKENAECNNYNRIIAGSVPYFTFSMLGDDEPKDDELWVMTSPEKVNEITELTDTDKLLILFLGTWESETNVDELKIPDTVKKLGLSYDAFRQVNIGKLILPDCPIKIDKNTFPKARIKEIVFEGDATIDNMMFYGNETIENVTFEKNADLAYSAFWGCDSLSNVNMNHDIPFQGRSFNMCRNLKTFNNESLVNEDGSPKPEYKDFIEKNFSDADDIGFLNKYTSYRVKQAVSEAVTDDMPDIVKVKALHDKLCSMTTYDTGNVDDVKNHVDVSVFLNNSTVCEGYARAMNLMLHEAGIESCFVDTDDHAWVIVKLGDHYFHVDPTWDDGDTVKYDWFMKSDAQIDGKDSHTNWELKCPSSMHSFQWKTMPQCTDIMGDVDDNDIIDGRDATAILTSYAKTSVGGKEEVDSILADFNYDGIVDGRDASAVLTHYAKSSVDN